MSEPDEKPDAYARIKEHARQAEEYLEARKDCLPPNECEFEDEPSSLCLTGMGYWEIYQCIRCPEERSRLIWERAPRDIVDW